MNFTKLVALIALAALCAAALTPARADTATPPLRDHRGASLLISAQRESSTPTSPAQPHVQSGPLPSTPTITARQSTH